MKDITPARQVEAFLEKYSPEVAGVARAARRKLRVLLPGTLELVYDNYNALAIGFGPTEKVLDTPALRQLIEVAVARHPAPIDAGQRRRVIIKSVSARQRPRRALSGKRRGSEREGRRR